MSNYKIHVKDETESRQAQKYFFALGCLWSGNSAEFQHTHMPYLYAYMDNKVIMHGDIESKFHTKPNQELTLDQLQDLYILHRNDVNDANHSMAVASDRPDYPIFKTHDDVFHTFATNINKWVECKSIDSKTTGLKPIQKQQVQTDTDLIADVLVNNAPIKKPNCISGAEALRDLADGFDVEFFHDSQGWVPCKGLVIDQVLGDLYQFRLKPKISLINGIEVPECGLKHQHGQLIWILNSIDPREYCSVILDENDKVPPYWWDSEEKIKQVVVALRKVFEAQL